MEEEGSSPLRSSSACVVIVLLMKLTCAVGFIIIMGVSWAVAVLKLLLTLIGLPQQLLSNDCGEVVVVA